MASGYPIILDGAFGTELERRGFVARLPLWSALALIEAPDLVQTIHKHYLAAGADILTAATFRTTRYTLAKAGMADRAEELTRLAIRLAREVLPPLFPPYSKGGDSDPSPFEKGGKEGGSEFQRFSLSAFQPFPGVAASLAPLEDCYRPDLCPPDEILLREHAHTARLLRDAGADLILVETQNSAREAQIATEMALNMGLPVWTSFMPKSATELYNGDSLTDAARVAFALGANAVLINCCPPDLAAAAFQTLRAALPEGDILLGAYPNFRAPEGKPWDFSAPLSPAEFARWGEQMVSLGANILGGCCGTTPEHIAALSEKLKAES
ncbi:MAG TPA: homocysteine S-methyltransferase family protein [bacterium]|jgi:S-methylmethionine-dependent homocysteine/selenocysteine methylase